MGVLNTVLPVLLLLGIGMFCRMQRILSSQGVHDLKSLISNILLPVTLVHALGNANYDQQTIWTVLLIFLLEVIAMTLGFTAKPLVHSESRAMLPVVTTTAEAGQLGYPLYIILCGSAALGNMATMDISVTLFGFTIWCAYISQADSGAKFSISDMLSMAKHNPCLWAVALGISLGVSGFLPWLESSSIGEIYKNAQATIVSPLAAMILIVLGYDLKFQKELMKEALKLIFIRFAIQMFLLSIVWFLLGRQASPDMQTAILLFFFLPVAFSSQVYAKKEHNRLLLSTVASCYALITIAAFAVISGLR